MSVVQFRSPALSEIGTCTTFQCVRACVRACVTHTFFVYTSFFFFTQFALYVGSLEETVPVDWALNTN